MTNEVADIDDAVRVALVGLGGHGRTIQDAAYQADSLRVVAVFDVDEREMEAAGRRFGCSTARSYEDLLREDGLEAVVLATPNALHRAQTEAALNAGLDVFVEKPIANHVDDGLVMVRAAEETSRILAVGHNMRFCRSINAAKATIEDGVIGQPVTMEIHFSADNVLHLPKESWRLRPDECPALPIMQLAIHAIDILHFILSPVRSVFAWGRTVAAPPGVLDSVSATFRLEDGLEGVLISNYCTEVRFEFRLSGTEGTLFFTPHRYALSRTGPRDRTEEVEDFSEFDRDSYLLQLEAFARSVRDRSRPPIDGWDGLKALAVVEALDGSIRSGRTELVAELSDDGSKQETQAH